MLPVVIIIVCEKCGEKWDEMRKNEIYCITLVSSASVQHNFDNKIIENIQLLQIYINIKKMLNIII